MKNTLEEFTSWLDETEEWTKEMEDRVVEITKGSNKNKKEF